MEDTSGFYKLDGDVMLYGPRFVINAAYELRRETQEQNTYPVDGWHWFNSENEANAALRQDWVEVVGAPITTQSVNEIQEEIAAIRLRLTQLEGS